MRHPRILLAGCSILALAACGSSESPAATRVTLEPPSVDETESPVAGTAPPVAETAPPVGETATSVVETAPGADIVPEPTDTPAVEPQAGASLTVSADVTVTMPPLPDDIDMFNINNTAICDSLWTAGVFSSDAPEPRGAALGGFNGEYSLSCMFEQPYNAQLGDMSTASDVFFETVAANAALTGEDEPFADELPGDSVTLTINHTVNENDADLFDLADEPKNLACAAVGALTGIDAEWSYGGYSSFSEVGSIMCVTRIETGVELVTVDQAAADAWFASNPLPMDD